MLPNKRNSRSHFVTLSHYNRLRTLRSPASSHSFRSDYSETIQSLSSSPDRSPQVPTDDDDNNNNEQKSKLKPAQQAASSSSSPNPPKALTPTRKAKTKKQKTKLTPTPTQQASTVANTSTSSSSGSHPDPKLANQSVDGLFVPEVSPVLYHFDEISYAIHDPLSEHLSSWICTLRNEKVIVLRRAFNGKLTNSRLTAISKSRHSSLARLLGASLRGNHIFIVYEYLAGASLKRCLHLSSFSNWILRMRVALDVAKGLEYIHLHCDTVHSKMRSSNIILVEPKFSAKICLFGESDLALSDENNLETELEQPDSHCLGIEEGTCYVAPEVLAGRRMSKKSDVFAFGVLILELISGKAPLGYRVNKHTLECEMISLIETAKHAIGTDNGELEGEGRRGRIRLWADQRLQNSFPIEVMEELIGLGLRCVEADPSKRPEMVLVATTISKLFLHSLALVPISRLFSPCPSQAEQEGDLCLDSPLTNYLDCDVFPQAEQGSEEYFETDLSLEDLEYYKNLAEQQ